jgi:hypothetical protein
MWAPEPIRIFKRREKYSLAPTRMRIPGNPARSLCIEGRITYVTVIWDSTYLTQNVETGGEL